MFNKLLNESGRQAVAFKRSAHWTGSLYTPPHRCFRSGSRTVSFRSGGGSLCGWQVRTASLIRFGTSCSCIPHACPAAHGPNPWGACVYVWTTPDVFTLHSCTAKDPRRSFQELNSQNPNNSDRPTLLLHTLTPCFTVLLISQRVVMPRFFLDGCSCFLPGQTPNEN